MSTSPGIDKRVAAGLALAAAIALAAALLLGAGLTRGSASAAARRANAPVRIAHFKFHPKALTVSTGTKVVFTNNDKVKHTATDAGVFNTHGIRPGKSKSVVFSTAGTFSYTCRIHPFMHGTVVVK